MGLSGIIHAEDWTIAGRTYQNVKVTRTEADCVHVMYDGGIGSIKLADMPPDLQKRFNYAAADAVATAQKREADRQAAVKQMEASAPRPTPTATAVSYQPNQTGPTAGQSATASAKPAIDRGNVQMQINELNQSIAQQEQELARNNGKEITHAESSQNPYRNRIAEEQREVAELTAELNGR